MGRAFKYIESNPLMLEADYAYTGEDGSCSYDASKGVGKVNSFEHVNTNSELELKAAVMQGPVSVGIEADQAAFQYYHDGVLTDNFCGTNLDHGVLVVGYGKEMGLDYFLVKNSWGKIWGQKGYVKIGADESGPGACGIQMDPSIPFAEQCD